MKKIYEQFEYHTDSTDIDTPTRQALSQKQGVCQDFAHIFISCLRSLGLPAKYISGYLLTTPPPGKVRLIGSDASHAWASVYIPSFDLYNNLGPGYWFDFDPTNNRWGQGTPGEDYIFLAQGRDYADVSPIRGVIKGGAEHDLKVAVTVRPVHTN
jgi:transglutaminase-like putative cysteine protease